MAYGTPMQNQNKGYAAQEKKDLLGDMPIDKRASGGSWISKHAQSSRMSSSPLHQEVERPDPSTLINKKGQSQEDVMNAREAKVTGFRNKIKDLEFTKQSQVDKANEIDAGNVNAFNKSNDSISQVNTNYNKNVNAYNESLAAKNKKIDDLLN